MSDYGFFGQMNQSKDEEDLLNPNAINYQPPMSMPDDKNYSPMDSSTPKIPVLERLAMGDSPSDMGLVSNPQPAQGEDRSVAGNIGNIQPAQAVQGMGGGPSQSSVPYVNPDDIERDRALKSRMNLIGNLTDIMGSSQGIGNYYLGHMNQQSRAGEGIRRQAEINSPVAQKQAQMAAQEGDPNSPANQDFRKMLNRLMPGAVGKNATLSTMKDIAPKLVEGFYKAQEANSMKQLMFQNKVGEQNYKHGEGAQKELNKDKNYVAAKGAIEEADKVDSAVDDALRSGGYASKAALAPLLSRVASGGAKINRNEMEEFKHMGGSMTQLNSMAQAAATGKITPEVAQSIKRFNQAMRSAAQKTKSKIEGENVSRYQSLNPNASEEQARNLLIGKPQEPQRAIGSGGGLDMNDPKIKEALAAGYTEDEIRQHLGK